MYTQYRQAILSTLARCTTDGTLPYEAFSAKERTAVRHLVRAGLVAHVGAYVALTEEGFQAEAS